MYATSLDKVREYEVKRMGVKGVSVKYLLHAGVGAKRLQLRLFTLVPGGHTNIERHEHEHEVFVLRGNALFKVGGKLLEARPGYVIFIASNETHQIVNEGTEPLQFLCTKETSKAPSEMSKEKSPGE